MKQSEMKKEGNSAHPARPRETPAIPKNQTFAMQTTMSHEGGLMPVSLTIIRPTRLPEGRTDSACKRERK
jgi:hypothetical protein